MALDDIRRDAIVEHPILAGPCSEDLAQRSIDHFTTRHIPVALERLEGVPERRGFVVVEAQCS